MKSLLEQMQEKDRIIMEDDPHLKEQLRKDLKDKEERLQ